METSEWGWLWVEERRSLMANGAGVGWGGGGLRDYPSARVNIVLARGHAGLTCKYIIRTFDASVLLFPRWWDDAYILNTLLSCFPHGS